MRTSINHNVARLLLLETVAWINVIILMVVAGGVIIRTSGPRNVATPIAGSHQSLAGELSRLLPAQLAELHPLSWSRFHLLHLLHQL
jgi:hypothetical protein